jgi:hypothetical protein
LPDRRHHRRAVHALPRRDRLSNPAADHPFAYAAILILPIPVAIHEITGEATRHWHWLAMRQPSIGSALAVTFANYEVMASPLLFTAFFLATSPAIRPLARRGRVIYALLVGALSARQQLYVSVSVGPVHRAADRGGVRFGA